MKTVFFTWMLQHNLRFFHFAYITHNAPWTFSSCECRLHAKVSLGKIRKVLRGFIMTRKVLYKYCERNWNLWKQAIHIKFDWLVLWTCHMEAAAVVLSDTRHWLFVLVLEWSTLGEWESFMNCAAITQPPPHFELFWTRPCLPLTHNEVLRCGMLEQEEATVNLSQQTENSDNGGIFTWS